MPVPGSRILISSIGERGVPTVVARASRGAPGRVVRNSPSPMPNSCPDHSPRRSRSSNRAGGTFVPERITCVTDAVAAANPASSAMALKCPCPSRTWVARSLAISGRETSRSAVPRTRQAPALCGPWTAHTMPALWMTGIRWATRVSGVPAPRAGVGCGVVPVFGVQPGDHLGHAGRAAGELEDRHVLGVDPALDLLDGLAGGLRIRTGAQRLDRRSGGAARAAQD